MKRHHATFLGALLALGFESAWAADVNGTLQWVRRAELGTPVSGVVTEVTARVGQLVERGAVLVRLDDRAFRAELNKARAERDRLAQNRGEAERELQRAQELYDRTLLSDHELEVAKIAFASAEAQYAAAAAAYTQAELALEYSAVRAPFEAVVLGVPATAGQTVVSTTAATPLVAVAERGRMLARVSLDESRIGGLALGRSLEVRIDSRRYSGKVYRLGLEPIPDGESVRYPVDVIFETDEVLRAGQRAVVALP